MNFTDELEIAGTSVCFKKDNIQNDQNKINGSWWIKLCNYTIEVSTLYVLPFGLEPEEEKLYITVKKDERFLIGSQTIPMTASKYRVLGIISKIISSYNQQLKDLESWADNLGG